MDKKNDLLKNLYLTEPVRENKKTFILKLKSENNISYPKMSKHKPGGILIQKWETKNNIPSEVDNLSLPIIVDKRKLLNSYNSERAITEDNYQDDPISSKVNQKNMRKLLLHIDTTNKKTTRNFNTEPSNQYLHTGESTYVETTSGNIMEDDKLLIKKRDILKNNTITDYIPSKDNYQQVSTNPHSLRISKPQSKIIDFTNYSKIETLTDNEFIYCMRVGNHIQYEECTYNQLKIKDNSNQKTNRLKDIVEYITISKNTILHFYKGQTTLYSVSEWRDNYVKSLKIMNIPLFRNYRIKKLYDLWRNFVKKHKKKFYEEKLKRKSVHVDPFLLEGIKQIKIILDDMLTKVNVFKYDQKDSAMTILMFQENHRQIIKQLDTQLEEYRNKIKKQILIACNKSYEIFKEEKKITLEDNYDFNSESKEEAKVDSKQLKSKNERSGIVVQNFLKDTMPYAQDATRRTHYKKLLKYIRLVDLLYNETKFKLITKSLESFTNKLQSIYENSLSPQINFSDSPLILFYMHPLKNTIKITPHIENIEKMIFDEFLTEKIYIVINRKCFIESKEFPNYMVCFEEVFDTAVDQNHNLNKRIREDDKVKEYLSSIKEIVNNSYQSIVEYSNKILPILQNYNKFEALNFKEFNNAKAEVLKSFLDKFLNESLEIAAIKPIVTKGIFDFNLDNLYIDFLIRIMMISSAPANWISNIRDLIPKIAVNKLKELIKNLNLFLKKLNQRPDEKDVETFITLKKDLEEIQDNKQKIEEQVQEIDDILLIVKTYKDIKIPEYESKLIKEKESLYVDFTKKIDAASYFIEMNIVRYRKELKDNIDRFDKKIHNLKNKINTDIINKYSKEQFSAIIELENQSVKIKKKKEKQKKFQELERDIKMEVFSTFENLDNLVYEYEVKSKLWYSLRDFQEHSEQWKATHIFSLDLLALDKEIDDYIMIAKTAIVDLDGTNIPQILLDQSIIYKRIIPVLKAFQNPNLRENSKRFFPMISKFLEIETDNFNNHLFTLDKLLELKIEEKLDYFIEISKQADEEKMLFDKFNSCKSLYNEKKIPFSIYPRGNNINDKAHKYYIKEDDLNAEYEFVEEKTMELQKILLNPYVDLLRDSINIYLLNFYKYLSFLDEYSKVQTYWFKSENYIGMNAQDLLKHFPIDMKKLNNVDNTLKSLGKIFKDNSNILSRFIDTSYAKVLESLKILNKNYDEVFRFIELSLDKKREDYNKYYFLSNEEILTLFSTNHSFEYLSKIIGKMINGIKSIDFGTDSDEIIKINTIDNEHIMLKVQKNRPVKDILDNIEKGIEEKIKFGFRLAKKEIKDNFKNDLRKFFPDILKNKEFLGQVIFMYIYYIMCDNIEKALSTQGDIFDKLLDLKFDCKERRTALISILQEYNYDPVDKKKLINIISLESYYNELIKNLIRDDVGTIYDFGWIKYINVYVESDDCRISHLNNKFEYGYEYVGLFSSFILPTQTERVFVTLSNSIQIKKPVFVYGLADAGKKETLKIITRLFGKSLIIFRCSQNFEEKAFDKLERGISKSGNWLCIDNMESLPINILSIIAEKIISFYRSYFSKVESKKNIQIFCSTNISSKMNLPDSMKNYFRLIGIATPDFGFIINMSLKNLGFTNNKKELKKKIRFSIEYLNVKFKNLCNKRITMSLFHKFIMILTEKVYKIRIGTDDEDIYINVIRKSLEKAFKLILETEDHSSLNKFLNSIFNTNEYLKKKNSFKSDSKDDLDIIIDDLTKLFNFANNDFKQTLKYAINSVYTRDYFVLNGPALSGKSYTLYLMKEISKKLSIIKKDPNLEIEYIKIFPKAYDEKILFSESPKASKIEFYNVYFLNIIKSLYETERKRDLATLNQIQKKSSLDLKPLTQSISLIKIICFDGQIDPLWIDYLNVMFDENKMQFLSNSDSINLKEFKFYFETLNLKFCTPSFVSKVTIFHFDQKSFSWENILYNWLNNNKKLCVNDHLKNYVRGLFENFFPKLMDFINTNRLETFHFKENFVMNNLINLYDNILPLYDFEDKKIGRRVQNLIPKIELIKTSALSIFIFCSAWTLSFFSNFILKNKIEKYIGDLFKPDDLKGPIFDYFIDDEHYEYALWNENIDNILPLSENVSYNKLFIPHEENIAYIWILEKFISNNKPVLYMGKPDSGKTLLITTLLDKLDGNHFRNINYLINYNSNSRKLEDYLLKNSSQIKRNLIGDKQDRKIIIFVDDVNLQKSDSYHSKNCLEFIRQILNNQSILDTFQNKTKHLSKCNFLCCGNLLSYGKNENTDRFVQKFNIMVQNIFANENIVLLFKSRLENHLKNYINNNTISITVTQYTNISLNINEALSREMRSSPIRLQYRFNLRDIDRIFQVIFNTTYDKDSDYPKFMLKLWYYETCRQYSDKLLTEDKRQFNEIVNNCCRNSLKLDFDTNYIFVPDFLNQKNNYVYYNNYNEILDKIKGIYENYSSTSKLKNIILHEESLSIIVKIMRILMLRKGHLIIIGSNHCGKQSLSQFSSFIKNKKFLEIDETILDTTALRTDKSDKLYTKQDNLTFWNKYIRKILNEAAFKGTEYVLYFSSKIMENDIMLDQINNLMNTSEIENTFGEILPDEEDKKRNENYQNNDNLEEELIEENINKNLHFIISVKPTSSSYRKLFYNYYFISKYCSCLYYDKWNDEVLLQIVRKESDNHNHLQLNDNLMKIFLETHHYCCSLMISYKEKIRMNFEFSSNNYIEMINYFKKYSQLFRNKINKQIESLNKIVNSIQKSKDVISASEEEIERNKPIKIEKESLIDSKRQEIIEKKRYNNNLITANQEDEKPLNIKRTELSNITEEIENYLSEYKDIVVSYEKIINKFDSNDLIQIRNTNEHMMVAKFIIGQIYSLSGESSDWEFFRKNTDVKIIKNAVDFNYTNLDPFKVKIIKETVKSPEFVYDNLKDAIYQKAKTICEWFKSVNDYITAYESLKEKFDLKKRIQSKIEEYEKGIEARKEIYNKVLDEISEIDKQIGQIERNKEAILTIIEKRTNIKDSYNQLIDVIQNNIELWSNKLEAFKTHLDNCNYYSLFFAAYMSYATLFNDNYRKKLRNFFTMKAEQINIKIIMEFDYYSFIKEFLDLNKEKQNLLISLSKYDNYTRENILLMKMIDKTPYIIDHYNLGKHIIKDINLTIKTTFINPKEISFLETVEKVMKEGSCLVVEQADEKTYHLLKNIIRENYSQVNNKSMVLLDYQEKDINEKFNLIIIHNNFLNQDINSKAVIDTLFLNFIPNREQMKLLIRNELLSYINSENLNEIIDKSFENMKSSFQLKNNEEEIYNIFNNYDFHGMADKVNSNKELFDKLNDELNRHKIIIDEMKVFNSRKNELLNSQLHLDVLANDAAKIFKLFSKLIFIDNFYNYSIYLFSKIILSFYQEKFASSNKTYRPKQDLVPLIEYIYQKLSPLLVKQDKKLLGFVLVCHYLSENRIIHRNYKEVIYYTKLIFFSKKIEFTHSEESPIPSYIDNFTWNSLLQINDRTGHVFQIIIDSIKNMPKEWEGFMENNYNFTLLNEELEKETNSFIKFMFLSIVKPQLFGQFKIQFINMNFENLYKNIKIDIKKCLGEINNRRILLVIDNTSTSELEIIKLYNRKLNMEQVESILSINLKGELSEEDINKIINSMKFGYLTIIKEAQMIHYSFARLNELLSDPKSTIHENFRLILISKANKILSRSHFENCLIINRDYYSVKTMKDYIIDLLENLDNSFIDNIVNQKKNILFARKIFFHLIIVHAVIKQYYFFDTNLYYLPFEFNKKDLSNSLFFVIQFIKNFDKDKDDVQNYITLINLVFEVFYAGRLVYKEDFNRVIKLLLRYFEEEKFFNTNFYFYFTKNSKFNIKVEDRDLSSDEINKLLNDIPIEAYYNLLENISPILIKEKLNDIPKNFFSTFIKLYGPRYPDDENHHYGFEFNWKLNELQEKLKEIKKKIPSSINIEGENNNPNFMKLNKNGDLINPMDETLNREITMYNDFLKIVVLDIENMIKIYNGMFIYNEAYDLMLQAIAIDQIPKNWVSQSFPINIENVKNNKYTLNDWIKDFSDRIEMLSNWYQNGELQVFWMPLFFYPRLFKYNIINYFAKRNNITSEKVILKFALEDTDDISKLNRNNESFYINGLVLENCEYDFKNKIIIKSDKPCKVPIVRIDFYNKRMEDSNVSEIDEDNNSQNNILAIPFYERVIRDNFENIEPLGYVDFEYDDKEGSYDFWISVGIRLNIDV